MKPDLTNEADIKKIVDEFYGKALSDPLIGHFFKNLHIEEHLPKIYTFWTFIILHKGSYTGNAFDKHVNLGEFKNEHFTRWLELFTYSVEHFFAGPNANSMKERANLLSEIFRSKLVKN